ncbi:MAG: proprotein convertase P-domain-containing protein, partial [Candidatus Thalassarchaeum sp.]|nr:proprotein convertase P-domain-containing protein [Candidatus Thalassarchaeum sp.]
SHKYGFGAIDAGAAVALAESWTTLDTEMNVTYGPFFEYLDIPDDDTTWTEFNLTMPLELSIESIDVILDISHTYRGDLDIVLESPDGTESWLAEDHSDSGDDYSNWLFNTVQHWGESSLGEWKLKMRDTGSGDNGTLNSWEVIFHGVDIDFDHDDDGLSDENET